MAFIEINQVNKFYGAVQALHDVSLSVEKGEFVTLLGPSGSGKTTLLKILAGFEPISSGQIHMGGKEISGLPPEKRNFGLVFQGYALFPHMTVLNNICYPLRVRRMSKDVIASRAEAMLELVQLRRFAGRKPSELSGGQQQRVALARALVFQPELLLLDEPMSALDKKLRVDLQEELRDIHRTLGTTFINVTHDQEEAMHMSNRVAVMNNGRIEQYGSPFDLYRHPNTRFVADFVGKSNTIDGRVSEASSGGGYVFRAGDLTIPLGDARPQGDVAFTLRPEDAELCTAQAEDDRISMPGRVINSTYSGDRALYTVAIIDGHQMLVYGSARTGIHQNGAQVFVCFRPSDSLLLP